MKKLKAAAYCTLLSTVLTASTQAAVLANYTFGTTGQETTAETGAPYAATSTAANVTATAIADPIGTIGLEISSAATTPANAPFLRLDPQGNSATGAAAVTANKYFEFTVAATSGKYLSLSSLTFDVARGGAGTPRGYVVRSSVGNFATDLSGGDVGTARPTYTPVTVDLSGSAYTNLLTITFRVYSYSTGAGSSVDYDNFVVNGTVNTVIIPDTNLYSTNVVGFVNVDLQPGFSMVANQVNSANNSISSLLSALPNGSNFYKWNGSSFDIATYFFGTWDKPTLTLNPGEGGFVNVASATTLTLVGEVTQGNLVNNIPVGFSIRSSQAPQAGTATALGLTAALVNGDNLSKWDKANNKYTTFTYFFGSWAPSEPVLNLGESFFINHAGTATAWNRTFSVNP